MLVSGRKQKNSLNTWKNALKNQVSIEKTAFAIVMIRLAIAFTASEINEIIQISPKQNSINKFYMKKPKVSRTLVVIRSFVVAAS